MDPAEKTFLNRLAQMALANIGRDYPNHIQHLMERDTEARLPRELHPVFSGAYDWHSAVHNYWMLVRLLRLHPDGAYAAEARALIGRRLNTPEIEEECRYFDNPRRASWERPYGLAWLLQLTAELAEWGTHEARDWRAALAPLEALARERFRVWLPRLFYPIRSGEHAQTAFAFGMVLDWAHTVEDGFMTELLCAKSTEFYYHDVDAPLRYEPSGQDFLSPVLAEADLMRRVLPKADFAHWLSGFLPQFHQGSGSSWLEPAVSRDPTDPKLAHLDGLNLSRAWMMQGIATALPAGDDRHDGLRIAAERHAEEGLASIREEHYEGSHWLPSFAVYLITQRGLGT